MTGWELFIAYEIFFGSVLVAVFLVHGVVRLGCYVYKKTRTRKQDITLPW